MDDTDYAFGHSRAEYDRLIEQAELFRPLTERMLRAAGIRSGMHVLDVGCGVGDVSFLVAELVGAQGSVVGVDLDAEALKLAEQRRAARGIPNVEFHQSDLRLVESDQLFDAAVGRFILHFIKDPTQALRQIAERVRPGGIVAFHEPDIRMTIAPAMNRPVLARLQDLLARTFVCTGARPDVGTELYMRMLDVGLEPDPRPLVEIAVHMGNGEVAYSRWAQFARSFLPKIVEYGLATEKDILDILDQLRDELLTARGLVPLSWLMIAQWARKPAIIQQSPQGIKNDPDGPLQPSTLADLPIGELQLARPWYREISPGQWRAFWATFMGWVVDAFDFNILAFILIDIQKSFTVDRALVGALGTVTLVMRAVGGILAGTAADKIGRKLPLIISIVWFSVFAFLSGFSRSYAMLFALRALFGIGMGGEWAAGTPLALEHWPVRSRGLISGLLQGGWFWGYLLAAIAFQSIYPIFSANPHLGWRVMFWIAIVPAVVTLWILAGVPESPVWLEHQRRWRATQRRDELGDKPKISLVRIFQSDLLGTTIQTTAVMSAFMCSGYAITFWYPTLLRDAGRTPMPYLVAFNLGAVVGLAAFGRLSESILGRRGAVSLAALAGVTSIPFYLHGTGPAALCAGALTMGAFGGGIWGVAPAFVTERFPTATRGIGPGLSYHVAAAVGSTMPVLMGVLQDRGTPLKNAMTIAIAVTLILSAGLIWLGPETRGRNFNET